MHSSIKYIVAISVILISSWFGWGFYQYMFSTSQPTLSIEGLETGSYCTGDSKCTIKGNDDYKVQDLSISLDSKPLVSNYKINKRSFEYPLVIPTANLSNGKHTLKVDITSAAKQKAQNSQEIQFSVDNQPLHAALVKGTGVIKYSRVERYMPSFR